MIHISFKVKATTPLVTILKHAQHLVPILLKKRFSQFGTSERRYIEVSFPGQPNSEKTFVGTMKVHPVSYGMAKNLEQDHPDRDAVENCIDPTISLVYGATLELNAIREDDYTNVDVMIMANPAELFL